MSNSEVRHRMFNTNLKYFRRLLKFDEKFSLANTTITITISLATYFIGPRCIRGVIWNPTDRQASVA